MLSSFCSPLNSIPDIPGIISVVTAGIISVVIGGHFGGGDHFDGGDHFGDGTDIFIVYTQDVTDASVNTCCKLKLVFFEKRL